MIQISSLHGFALRAPKYSGRDSVMENNGTEGRRIDKKRMTPCNEMYRGSKQPFHKRLIKNCRAVFRCMHGGKPVNVRYSITPKTGERLTNTRMSVNGLQTGITKAVIE